MDLKRFVMRTLEDTIGFFQVHVRMLERLRDATECEKKSAGIQEAIDVLNNSCETGRNTADLYVAKRMELLQKTMHTEAEEASCPALDACGTQPPKKKNLN